MRKRKIPYLGGKLEGYSAPLKKEKKMLRLLASTLIATIVMASIVVVLIVLLGDWNE